MLPLLILACPPASPTTFMTFPAGPRSIACLGDVDGDGVPDLALGAPFAVEELGAAYVVSGKTGKLLTRATAPEGARMFGCSVAAWVDWDADGVRDFAVSAPGLPFRPSKGDPQFAGSLFVCSGKTCAVLARVAGRQAGDAFGVELACLGDLDLDGKPELLVGSPGMGQAYVLSGKDGAQIRAVGPGEPSAQFGEAVTGLGDVDGDAIPDFAVGACMESLAGRVHLFSGKDGHELRVLAPKAQFERLWFGNGLSAAPDLDGDGKADVLVGTDMEGYEFCARIYSSATGDVLRTITQPGDHMFDHFGAAVETLGDADGDGVADVLIADSDDTPEVVPEHEANQARGSVVVASGKTGATLFKVFGKKHMETLGHGIASCGDLDGDHVPDFVAMANVNVGRAPLWRAFSGKDGKELWEFVPSAGKR